MDNMVEKAVIVFRVDCSVEIGVGHFMRCLALAGYFFEKNFSVIFICRDLKGFKKGTIDHKGIKFFLIGKNKSEVFNMQEDVKETIRIIASINCTVYLIVDNYNINKIWEEQVRPYVKKLLVIDDEPSREHYCDYLVDPGPNNCYEKYQYLISQNCFLMLGLSYAIIRKNFIKKKKLFQPRKALKHILINFGGSDASGLVVTAIQALIEINFKGKVDVILPIEDNVLMSFYKNHKNIRFYPYAKNLEDYFFKADLAIGAAGVSTWERCYCGLPVLAIAIAQNQVYNAKAITQYNVGISMGYQNEVSKERIKTYLARIDSNHLTEMSINANNLIDGNGCKKIMSTFLS